MDKNTLSISKLLWIYSISYIIIFIIPYAIIPNCIGYEPSIFPYVLAQITIVSVISFLIALNLKMGPKIKHPVLKLNFSESIFLCTGVFVFVVLIILITAPKIPIIESFRGADPEQLSQYREDFLKSRQGWESSLGYIVGIITGAILPYLISVAFIRNHKHKFLFAIIFMVYCISFLEKAYFLKLALPIFFIYLLKSKNKGIFLIKGFLAIFLLIAFMYIISGASSQSPNDEVFFSMSYLPSGVVMSILWRSAIVPIVTALDGIKVFLTEFHGQYFYGNTSSFISFLRGGTRINFERYLYQFQFGGSETGNANQFYLLESYINFGFIGVFIFSFIVGRLLRGIIVLKDIAALSIMPLFIFNLFTSGLIGILLSNGFILFFILVKFVRFK